MSFKFYIYNFEPPTAFNSRHFIYYDFGWEKVTKIWPLLSKHFHWFLLLKGFWKCENLTWVINQIWLTRHILQDKMWKPGWKGIEGWFLLAIKPSIDIAGVVWEYLNPGRNSNLIEYCSVFRNTYIVYSKFQVQRICASRFMLN